MHIKKGKIVWYFLSRIILKLTIFPSVKHYFFNQIKIDCIIRIFLLFQTAFTVDVNRTYFYNNPNPNSNPFVRSYDLPNRGVDKTSDDIEIEWTSPVDYENKKLLRVKVTFDYHGKFPTEVTSFSPVDYIPDSHVMKNVGLNFFDRIMTVRVRESSVSITKGATPVMGHLKWNRNYATGIHCEEPVKITMEMTTVTEDYYKGDSYQITTKAVYEGEFKTDGDWCPK
ncbi:uncharacterized protein LOC117168345 [Belonocnema kinseyi]|uniref:uncharacterized protein LOC117168345 n=1 Tax=Belonocnema kinseyi TaxID=2817044 RepID=UPI00143D6C48|nr:uncharacterized protein LOC117168345 [Belonocnema kinseyi]